MEKTSSFSFETFKPFAFKALEDDEGHDPNEPLRFQFSNRVIYKDFVAKIQIRAASRDPRLLFGMGPRQRSALYLLAAPARDQIYGRIAADLKDEFGNVLGKEIQVNFTTAAMLPFGQHDDRPWRSRSLRRPHLSPLRRERRLKSGCRRARFEKTRSSRS